VVGRPLGLLIDENDVRWTVAAVVRTCSGRLSVRSPLRRVDSLPWIARLGIVGQGDVFHPLLYLAIAFMIPYIPLFPV
jgi:hypothetical protein